MTGRHIPSYCPAAHNTSQIQATCSCGWAQEPIDCGSQLRSYLIYADHLREDAVERSRRDAVSYDQHDRRAA
ncbi:hypothetical protein GCM10010331_44690 [Streptomyces xanthochromogenes]|uniref:hypothetical protein n=1 Tax=Streptomyces xanthochromogenes TaxID=67384 RepID=UPI00167788F5|nr:hypothetical protein [Streptomyces xanthochromogenes]GHB52164.1 hypothetical protein GCM10010331_44690 [Streptomyces xanthochromogenes]